MPDKSVEVLADEIFGLVEDAQGKGFVSDGLGALPTTDALLATVRSHLRHTERAARIMRSWLKRQEG